MRRKGSACSSASRRSHVEYDEALGLGDGGFADDAAFALRDLGTEDARKGTADGPESWEDDPDCDPEGIGELVRTAMTAVVIVGIAQFTSDELAHMQSGRNGRSCCVGRDDSENRSR